jgi:acyl-CoA synthetase (AMP-forming)/AMP-acid ligase II
MGAVAVNINWLLRPRQVEFILSQCDAHALVTTDAWELSQPRRLETRSRVVRIENVAARGTLGPIAVDASSPAQITYTSGSTGLPRGVVTSHANLWAGVGPVVRYLGLDAHDRIASLLPFSYVYGFSQLTCALAVGARLDVIGATIPADVVASIAKLQTTVVAGVPPLWQQLLATSRFRDPIRSLRVLTCAGGRLAPDLVRAVRKAQPQ